MAAAYREHDASSGRTRGTGRAHDPHAQSRRERRAALANVSGDIVVTRGGGNEVSVEIIKTARGRTDDDARELLQLVQVEVVERGAAPK